jgi:hypothetical protein
VQPRAIFEYLVMLSLRYRFASVTRLLRARGH